MLGVPGAGPGPPPAQVPTAHLPAAENQSQALLGTPSRVILSYYCNDASLHLSIMDANFSSDHIFNQGTPANLGTYHLIALI